MMQLACASLKDKINLHNTALEIAASVEGGKTNRLLQLITVEVTRQSTRAAESRTAIPTEFRAAPRSGQTVAPRGNIVAYTKTTKLYQRVALALERPRVVRCMAYCHGNSRVVVEWSDMHMPVGVSISENSHRFGI